LTPKPDHKKLYITALEDRVAELETFLSGLGHNTVGNDHWKQTQLQSQDEERQQVVAEVHQAQESPTNPPSEEIDTLLGAVRDLVSSASTNYEGGKSTITMGRVLGSVIKTQKSPKSELDNRDEDPPKTISRAELVERMGPMFVSSVTATRLLDGWIKHLSTRYPVIHTPRLRELHARRNEELDVYEASILHLVYANSGRILETVCILSACEVQNLLTFIRQEKLAYSSQISITKQHFSTWRLF
jgi:hypothetical protein